MREKHNDDDDHDTNNNIDSVMFIFGMKPKT